METTFRWRPGPVLMAIASLGLVAPVFVFMALPSPLAFTFLPLWSLLLVSLLRMIDHRLRLDDSGVTLLRAGRAAWTLTWAELRDVRYEPGSLLSKNFDRLVLTSEAKVRYLTLDDRLSGRWNDPRGILTSLRERGYAV